MNSRSRWAGSAVLAAIILGALATLAAVAPVMRRQVVADGGGALASGGITLRGTTGQAVTASVSHPDATITVRSGFWQPGNAASGVDDTVPDLQGLRAGLRGNAPNPFNPMTTIRFAVGPGAAVVRLRIYDTAGHLVRTLHDGMHPAGRGAITWNGRDDRGGEVSSGLYFTQLVVGGQRFTGKMMLVR